ncbi:2-polyprenyl-6-methoxyphenol hydroxylase-like FAD-dependent oxidoreductase [Bradyrhizobium diazoefficiens]
MTVLIAGGGIGGLTLALSLHGIGVPVKVFESVAELKPLGVGINVLPHAVRELTELGLIDKLDASGVRTSELAYFSKHGKPIWSEPRGLEAGYKWPQFSIHRGTLQQLLLDTAIERLGRDSILTSHHLTGWTETADGVRADFIDKATGKAAGTYEGAIMIAADGIHSAAREKLYPDEGPADLERPHPLARRDAGKGIPHRPHHDHGRARDPEIRLLSDQQGAGCGGQPSDQLGR